MARKPAPRKRGESDDDAGDGRKIGKDHNVKKFDGEILSK
mgnify:FL=1